MKLSLIISLALIFTFIQYSLNLTTNASYFKRRPDGKPYIIAHRGASGQLPEHTLEGHIAAMYMHADFVEPDLQPTKDNYLIVIHGLLSETTNVAELIQFQDRKSTKLFNGVNVTDWYTEDFTLKEIKTLKRRQRYPIRNQVFNDLFTIPTFEEYIEAVMETNALRKKTIPNAKLIGIYPELKYPNFFDEQGYNVSKLLFDVLQKYDLITLNKTEQILPVIVQNFFPYVLEFFRDNTELPLIYLVQIPEAIVYKEIVQFAHGISPRYNLLFEKGLNIVENSHQFQLQVVPWTIQDDVLTFAPTSCAQYKILEDLQVDGIFTEFPENADAYFNTQYCETLKQEKN